MKRRRYPECVRKILPKQALLGLYTVFPIFGLGLYLRLVHDLNWATWVFGISAILVFGLVSQILQKKLYGSLPCPYCGRTHLTQSKTHDRWHILTCESCSVEWETGLGDGDNP
jgi:hypothetical protein